MSASDAKPVPRKGEAYRAYFPILDADGDLVVGMTGLAAVVSKDGAMEAASTNSPVEIAGVGSPSVGSGKGYLDLTATEMDADAVVLTFTVTNTGAKATILVLYPEETGDIRVNPTALNSDATAVANLAKTARAIGRGTVAGGATTTSIPTSAFSPTGVAADQFKGRIITFDADTVTAALRGQSTDITGTSEVGSPTMTTFAVTALTTAPASGDTFSVT